jgi:PAS domain S-box-containing protein
LKLTLAKDGVFLPADMISNIISIHDFPIPMSISEFSGGKITDINKPLQDLTWITSEEINEGRTSIELGLLPDIQERNLILEIKLNGYFRNKEIKFNRKDGSVLNLLVSCQKIKQSGGDYLLTTYQDITRLKYTENSLRESEKQYRELVDNARTIILKMDTEGRFTFVNEYALAFFGYSAEEILGKAAFETIVPELESTGRDLGEMIGKLFKDPDQFSLNINENIKKNGERVWIEWHNKALFDEKGKRIGHLAVGVDITQRKKNEESLVAAQEKLAIALENGNIGLWEWDFLTDKLIWDERSEKMFGLIPGTFTGTLESFERTVVEEDLPIIRKATQNSIEHGLPYEAVFRIRINDNVRWISAKALVKKDASGKNRTMIGVSFDITGLREETDKAITRLNDELLRSNKELENFAYVASHDLQEPLRMVTSFTQLLQKRYGDKLDEDANTYIQFAVDGSKRMYELLNGLLAFSRIKTSSLRRPDWSFLLFLFFVLVFRLRSGFSLFSFRGGHRDCYGRFSHRGRSLFFRLLRYH